MVRLRRGPSLVAVECGGVQQESDRGARRRVGMAHAFPATGRIASRPASGSRMMLEKKPEAARFGRAGTHAYRRQPHADPVEKAVRV